MDRERHEEILNDLLNPEIEQTKRTELLQELRADNSTMLDKEKELTTNNEKLQKNNDDLVISNSQLFRKLGIMGGDEEMKDKENQKSFSESVTIEDIEKQTNA